MKHSILSRLIKKVSEAGAPHEGWNCVGFEDLGEPAFDVKCARPETFVLFIIWNMATTIQNSD